MMQLASGLDYIMNLLSKLLTSTVVSGNNLTKHTREFNVENLASSLVSILAI